MRIYHTGPPKAIRAASWTTASRTSGELEARLERRLRKLVERAAKLDKVERVAYADRLKTLMSSATIAEALEVDDSTARSYRRGDTLPDRDRNERLLSLLPADAASEMRELWQAAAEETWAGEDRRKSLRLHETSPTIGEAWPLFVWIIESAKQLPNQTSVTYSTSRILVNIAHFKRASSLGIAQRVCVARFHSQICLCEQLQLNPRQGDDRILEIRAGADVWPYGGLAPQIPWDDAPAQAQHAKLRDLEILYVEAPLPKL